MESIKNYFSCDHRMNRKPYIMAVLILIVLYAGIYAIMLKGALPTVTHSMKEISKETTNGTVTQEEASRKITEVGSHITPVWFYFAYAGVYLLLVPAAVMRLKDLNWSPWIAALMPIKVISYLMGLVHLSGPIHFPGPIFLVSSAFSTILGILLIFVPGTKGPNKYGPDPLEEKAV